jgi:glycine/D-amino acid oxidase-like deaminating enzyme
MSTPEAAPGGSANRSPWLEEPRAAREPAPLAGDLEVDVAIVGGGIAGLATAFFAVCDAGLSVALLDAGRVACGATGHNAGQLVSYFEQPLCALADRFGFEPAIAAQREVDGAWALLDRMRAVAAPELEVQRFLGHMGMWSENHLEVHLRSNRLRERGGLARERCLVSAEAGVPAALERTYGDLFEVVPQAQVAELLETRDDRYRAVLSFTKGTLQPVLLCEGVAAYLRRVHPERFALAEGARVDRIELDASGATLAAGAHRVRAARVVLCTNGYAIPSIERRLGPAIDPARQQSLRATVGYMAAFLEPGGGGASAISYLASPRIGEGQAYFYVTRRPFARDGRAGTLVCIGGPDAELGDPARYDAARPVGAGVLARLDDFIRPILAPDRAAPLPYDYAWHGVMGYARDGVRVVGADPRHSALLYNLGCNGVGLLPSLAGGARVARLLAGAALAPSLFDPR